MGILASPTPQGLQSSTGPDRSGTRQALDAKGDAVSWTTLIGLSLSELLASETPVPLGIRLRILFDAVLALAELHENAAERAPRYHHGHVTPADIVVALNGLSHVLNVPKDFRRQKLPSQPRRGYLAPELLLRKYPGSHGADVFALGVCLWEALVGRRLFPERRAQLLFDRIRAYELPATTAMPSEAWALLMVAEKAFSYHPKNRYPSAVQLLADMHHAAGNLLATHADVAKYLQALTGLSPNFRCGNSDAAETLGPVTALSSRCAAEIHPSPVCLPKPPGVPSIPEMEAILGRGFSRPARAWYASGQYEAPSKWASIGAPGPTASELPTLIP